MATDFVSSLTTAISLVTQLKKIGEKLKDGEFKNLLADLQLELTDAKLWMVTLMQENADLQKKVTELEG